MKVGNLGWIITKWIQNPSISAQIPTPLEAHNTANLCKERTTCENFHHNLFSQSQILGVFFFFFFLFCKFAKWQKDFSGCWEQIVLLAQVERGDTLLSKKHVWSTQTWYFHLNFSGFNRMTEAFYKLLFWPCKSANLFSIKWDHCFS